MRTFWDICESLVVSEASAESMFSFFKRSYVCSLRKSLKLKTLVIQSLKLKLNPDE
jgi:hypothetical protein